jgi:hypothetical protein
MLPLPPAATPSDIIFFIAFFSPLITPIAFIIFADFRLPPLSRFISYFRHADYATFSRHYRHFSRRHYGFRSARLFAPLFRRFRRFDAAIFYFRCFRQRHAFAFRLLCGHYFVAMLPLAIYAIIDAMPAAMPPDYYATLMRAGATMTVLRCHVAARRGDAFITPSARYAQRRAAVDADGCHAIIDCFHYAIFHQALMFSAFRRISSPPFSPIFIDVIICFYATSSIRRFRCR